MVWSKLAWKIITGVKHKECNEGIMRVKDVEFSEGDVKELRFMSW